MGQKNKVSNGSVLKIEVQIERTIEEDLELLLEKSKKVPSLAIRDIMRTLSERARLIIIILLSIPFCQPIPLPGLSTIFGLAIAFIGLRITLGKRIWLPKKVLLKKIPSKIVYKITKGSLFLLKKARRFMHPRLTWLCDHSAMRVINGLLIILLALLLALPLPIPFTNIVIGISLIVLSLGLLETDGLIMIVGYFLSLVSLIFFGFVISYPLVWLCDKLTSALP